MIEFGITTSNHFNFHEVPLIQNNSLSIFLAVNPAIMAAEETVGVVQGRTVQLEVYVSGYPEPTSSHITWYRPDRTEIMATDTGVAFQDSNRRLVISNVQPEQAGSYECYVEISLVPYMGASTAIQLEVYGEFIAS